LTVRKFIDANIELILAIVILTTMDTTKDSSLSDRAQRLEQRNSSKERTASVTD